MKDEIWVVKVGTSTLTYENGRVNLRRMESLCRALADLQNAGKRLVLVSSGAIGVGMGKLGLKSRPAETEKKQALAAVGQCELMFLYDKFFGEYNQTVAQVLLTAGVVHDDRGRHNVENTFRELLTMGTIPIVNENDTVAVEEIEFGDNDTLSAVVAQLTQADVLVLMSDINGLYSGNPRTDSSARLIPRVDTIDSHIKAIAQGAGSSRGTGGMITKIHAAEIACGAGIDMAIINGEQPEQLYRLFDGEAVGTHFAAHPVKKEELP